MFSHDGITLCLSFSHVLGQIKILSKSFSFTLYIYNNAQVILLDKQINSSTIAYLLIHSSSNWSRPKINALL